MRNPTGILRGLTVWGAIFVMASVVPSASRGTEESPAGAAPAATTQVEATPGVAAAPETKAAEGKAAEASAGEESDEPHPTPPANAAWAGTVLAAVGLMFLGALLVGPFIDLQHPEEVPPAQSHDEPPGASHLYGPEGTNPPHDSPHDSHGAHH